MKVELFVVADYAANQGGKLTIVGVFDTIVGPNFPIVHASCSVAVKIRFEKIEEGSKRVRLTLTDADGKPVLPSMDIPLEVQMNDDNYTCTREIVGNINGMKFEKGGEYSFDLVIDGRHEASVPLFVRQLQRPNS
jgi:hypothetical protein